MTETLNYGIIGCGMMGQEHIHNIALLDNAAVRAIYEPDAGMRAESLRNAPNAEMVNSIDALLAIPDLTCLLIASPNYLHMEQLEQIAATRALPILVEKPLFTAIEDLDRLNAFIETYPEPVWVAMEYRYMPPVAAFLNEMNAVTGGLRMLSIREHRFPFLQKVGDWNRFNAKTGGTFVEKCCHFFDLMRLAVGSEPVRVMASGGQDVNHLDEVYEGQTSDILDNGFVLVEFENGVRAQLDLCMFAEGSEYQEEILAIGPKGKIEAKVPGPGRFWPEHLGEAPVPQLILSPRDPKGPEIREIPVDPELLAAGDHNGSTYYQHMRFAQLVRGELAGPDVSLEDGKRAVLVGMAAQRSIEQKRSVELSEFGLT